MGIDLSFKTTPFYAAVAHSDEIKVSANRSDIAEYTRGWNDAIKHCRNNPPPLPKPARVIFHNPATIVYWNDGTKTVVRCQPCDTFNPETGLMAAMLKRFMGNNNTYNKVLNQWLSTCASQSSEHTD